MKKIKIDFTPIEASRIIKYVRSHPDSHIDITKENGDYTYINARDCERVDITDYTRSQFRKESFIGPHPKDWY